jgi:hypothetical protein
LSEFLIIPKPITGYGLGLLLIFISVIEHSGFAAAESALGVTHSTISVDMSKLVISSNYAYEAEEDFH